MTKDEIRAARSALGLSASRFGEAVGVNPRTVRRWEAGDSPVPGGVDKLLALMAENLELRAALLATTHPAAYFLAATGHMPGKDEAA